ncbi:MAG TPA: CapA family protein [Pseudobdellovibrionaceae bacterium]|nr:CapA family protein [Pseudobdellovibrionaceae bacterium]
MKLSNLFKESSVGVYAKREVCGIRQASAFALLTVFMTLAAAWSLPAHADLTLTFGGDVNFNKNKQAPRGDHVSYFGRRVTYEEMTRHLAPLIDGDVNFANIETVVTDDEHLPAQQKAFVFRSHPNSIRHLMDLGFNLFSLANNHAYNHGSAGLDHTLDAMEHLQRRGARPIAFAGIERRRADFERARIFEVRGYRIAFAAIGIIDPRFRSRGEGVGVLNYHDESDYALTLKSLREADADLKIISIHYGTEMQVELDRGQRAKFLRAISEGDADLVLGHHPHVVRPVELRDGRAIFYSLGNYLMAGAADLTRRAEAQDYGLFGRAHFARDARRGGRLSLQALEAVPLTGMHLQARPMPKAASERRIELLNQLSRQQLGVHAAEFRVRSDGRGVECSNISGLALSARAAEVCGN